MSPVDVLDVGRNMLWLVTLLVAPILGAALAVGLFIGILQAATQIQEMTLSFIPKLAAVAAVLFFVGPWMLTILVDFTIQHFSEIPVLLG
jgi:flagellar biosynthetic protein FliQ